MAFTVTPVNGSKPGDLLHFWDATFLDGDTDGPWIGTGFDFTDGLGTTVVPPAPLFTDVYSINGSANIYTGTWIVEINTAVQVATRPGYTNPLNGQVVAPTTFNAPVGGAWRLRKVAGLDSGGTARVAVGYFPGNLTNN